MLDVTKYSINCWILSAFVAVLLEVLAQYILQLHYAGNLFDLNSLHGCFSEVIRLLVLTFFAMAVFARVNKKLATWSKRLTNFRISASIAGIFIWYLLVFSVQFYITRHYARIGNLELQDDIINFFVIRPVYHFSGLLLGIWFYKIEIGDDINEIDSDILDQNLID